MRICVPRPGIRVGAYIAWQDGEHKGNCSIVRSYFTLLWGLASAGWLGELNRHGQQIIIKGKDYVNNPENKFRYVLELSRDSMVTKEEFSALHEEFVAFQAETRQNFRDVREDIADLGKETEFEFDDLLGRVKYVEQKLGIESGK